MARPLAFVALLLALLPLLACGGPEPGRPDGAERASAFEVPPTEVVQGRSIREVAEGAWTFRREARSPAPGARDEAEGSDAGGLAAPGVPVEDAEVTDSFEGAHGETDGDVPAPDAVSRMPAPTTPPVPPAGPREPADGVPPPAPKPGVTAGIVLPETQGGAPLKAGTTDDNLDFDAFLAFLATWSDREGVAERYDALDVFDRRFVSVVDQQGRPVPGARVHVVDESRDRVVWSGRTYGDGRLPFYPGVLARADLPKDAPVPGWLVEVRAGAAHTSVVWDGEGPELVVKLADAPAVKEPIALDVGILLDTTGSMGDEIARIKATLLEVTGRLRELGREFDLRLGAVLYRDLGDAYVTALHPFTNDVEAFAAAIQEVEADGGGDGPESVNQGLAEAVGRLAWRDGAAHVLFLIADAPPHMDYEGDVPYGTSLLAALDKGIRVHSVAASGLDGYGGFGSLVFRQIAQFTRGKFIFIEYGSAAASAASHGVARPGKSNNLDDILYEQITAELEGWGRPAGLPVTEEPVAGAAAEGE